MKKAEELARILVLQNTATIILYANYNKTGFLQFSIRKVIPAPSGTVRVHVGFPRKYPRTNGLDSRDNHRLELCIPVVLTTVLYTPLTDLIQKAYSPVS